MVVDDHRLLAEALASALKLRGHRVLAAAAPAAGAAELVITRAPEVCLIGTATPAEPGIFDPVVRIKRERPQVAVLVLGPVPNPRGIAAAFAAGASGYVRHDERIEGVERAIMKARAGEAAVAPQLLQGAFSELLNPAAQPDDEGQRLLQMLTPREVEVLVGSPTARTPGSSRPVWASLPPWPTHVQRVLMKLGVGRAWRRPRWRRGRVCWTACVVAAHDPATGVMEGGVGRGASTYGHRAGRAPWCVHRGDGSAGTAGVLCWCALLSTAVGTGPRGRSTTAGAYAALGSMAVGVALGDGHRSVLAIARRRLLARLLRGRRRRTHGAAGRGAARRLPDRRYGRHLAGHPLSTDPPSTGRSS